MDAQDREPEPVALALYDAECPFCCWSMAKLLAWDRGRRLAVLPLQDDAAAALLPGMAEAERMASWHLVERSGAVHSGGAALAPLIRLLPLGGLLARLAERMPRLSERAYAAVSRHRGRLAPAIGRGARLRARRRLAERTLPAAQARAWAAGR